MNSVPNQHAELIPQMFIPASTFCLILIEVSQGIKIVLIPKTIASENIKIDGLPVFFSSFCIAKVPIKLPMVEQIVQIKP